MKKTSLIIAFVALMGVQSSMAQKIEYRTIPREELVALERNASSNYNSTTDKIDDLKNKIKELESSRKKLKDQCKKLEKEKKKQKATLKEIRKAIELRKKLHKLSSNSK